MKLVITVVHDRDKNKITEALLRNGFKFTKIGSTGGFLREGNVTLLIGVEGKEVERVIQVISDSCKTREQFVNVLPPMPRPSAPLCRARLKSWSAAPSASSSMSNASNDSSPHTQEALVAFLAVAVFERRLLRACGIG